MSLNPQSIYADVMSCKDSSAELYLDLSVHFCGQLDVSWFWVEMAMEEKQEAGLLHYCLEKQIFAQNLPDTTKMQGLRRLLEDLRRRALRPPLSLDDAFDVAIQIESSELDDISRKLVEPINAPAYVLEKKLSLGSGSHLIKLRSAADRFPTSPAVRTRLANPH